MSSFLVKLPKLPKEIQYLGNGFKEIAKICYYLLHPKQLAFALWNWTFAYSYFICLVVGLFGLMFYFTGFKKGKKVAKGSILTYLLMNILNLVFKSC